MTVGWAAWWVFVALFVYSVGEITPGTGGKFKEVKWDKTTRYFWYIHWFGGLWWTAMIIAVAQFVIIVAVCTWYFSHGADTEGKASVLKGVKSVSYTHLTLPTTPYV